MPKVEVILLAAGASSRMRGIDKLTKEINGEPLLRHCTQAALGSRAACVHVVLQPDNPSRKACLDGLNIKPVFAQNWRQGMGASIAAGMTAISAKTEAVIISLADMPEITAQHFDALIDAFDPNQNIEITRNCTKSGKPGLPVLFGARFFPKLASVTSDQGAKEVIDRAYLKDVLAPDNAALVDLDTPEDWENWH